MSRFLCNFETNRRRAVDTQSAIRVFVCQTSTWQFAICTHYRRTFAKELLGSLEQSRAYKLENIAGRNAMMSYVAHRVSTIGVV